MSLPVVTSVAELKSHCDHARAAGARVGLVPTMGALHTGHLALLDAARARGAAFLVASVFVNPTQFGPNEDFARYPRDLEGDRAKLAARGAHLMFAPAPSSMYPEGEETRVRVGRLAEPLCGAFRPGHFEGVATVVAKLFSLVGPCVAVFGRKDYQQLRVIQRMREDLFFPVEVVGHPIVREADGLALSSRNAYLSPEERARALALSRGLRHAQEAFDLGERDAVRLVGLARDEVERVTDSIDYVELLDASRLTPLPGGRVAERALLAIACRIGKTRLIDNRVLGEDEGW